MMDLDLDVDMDMDVVHPSRPAPLPSWGDRAWCFGLDLDEGSFGILQDKFD